MHPVPEVLSSAMHEMDWDGGANLEHLFDTDMNFLYTVEGRRNLAFVRFGGNALRLWMIRSG